MKPKTDDDSIVREEAAAMNAEGNKRAAEDRAAADASRTEAEKVEDAERELIKPPYRAGTED